VKILVSAKRVTDPDARIRLKSDLSGIEAEGLEFKLNPFCENAIEEALRIQETQGAEVVAVCIGDDKANAELVRAMAMGADRSIRVEGTDAALDSDLVARRPWTATPTRSASSWPSTSAGASPRSSPTPRAPRA
jgi:electron transfer flavoprotein beta subunit